ncbi:MAG TPA: adenylate/guanylate cyclase domain-containing protein [Candidatus Paceibacterota bacterium]
MSQRLLKSFILFSALSAVVILLFAFSLFDIWQEKIFDKFFIKHTQTNDIIIFSVDNESINKVGQWPWSRGVFADAINKLQAARVIGIDVNFSESSRGDIAGDLKLSSALGRSKTKVFLPVQVGLGDILLEPLELFKDKSFVGVANVSLDGDGTVRKHHASMSGLQSFGLAIALEYESKLKTPDTYRIDYAGPEKTFLTLPITDLLSDSVPERFYEDKIVLIGATAPDLHDFFQTPVGFMSGVEIQANVLNTLIAQDFYRNIPSGLNYLIIIVINFIAFILIQRINKFSNLLFFLVLVWLIFNIFGIFLFSWKILFPVLYLNVGFILVSVLLILLSYFSESKEKKFIHDSFKYYLSTEVIDQLISDPAKLKLGGERKNLSILFSDIRGFTSISELMTPEDLSRILNKYLTKMTEVIMGQRGLVDKYIGDAIMAFWGAPINNPNHAEDACRSAIGMIRGLDKLNEYWSSENKKQELKIGVGINTGDAVVGNFGSKDRFNYTVIGDEVNLASRLEGLNKVYGTEILITESTKKEIESCSDIKTRELDLITVKGRSTPVLIYEVLVRPAEESNLISFKKGREFYAAGKWQEAIEAFSLSSGSDQASKLYVDRCKELAINSPVLWNGVYEFKTK